MSWFLFGVIVGEVAIILRMGLYYRKHGYPCPTTSSSTISSPNTYMIVTTEGGLPALALKLCGSSHRWPEIYECNPNLTRVVDGKTQYLQLQVSDIIIVPKGWNGC